MKQENINYFSVGLFVIGSILLLLVGLYNITGRGADADEYYVELRNVAGIRPGSPVTYAGFQIGQLLDIEPERNHEATIYKLKLQVRSGWQIPDNSIAQIITPSLLGEKQVDIQEGSSKKFFPVGATLQGKESADVFELAQNISKEFQKLSDEGLQPLLRTLNKDVAGAMPELMGQISKLVANLNSSASELQLILAAVDNKRIDKIVTNADKVSESLLGVTGKLDKAATELDKLVQTTSTMMDGNNEDLRKALLDLRTTMGVIEENMSSIMYNIDTTSRNLNEFSRQIRDNPSVIINSSAPKDSVRP